MSPHEVLGIFLYFLKLSSSALLAVNESCSQILEIFNQDCTFVKILSQIFDCVLNTPLRKCKNSHSNYRSLNCKCFLGAKSQTEDLALNFQIWEKRYLLFFAFYYQGQIPGKVAQTTVSFFTWFFISNHHNLIISIDYVCGSISCPCITMKGFVEFFKQEKEFCSWNPCISLNFSYEKTCNMY